MLLAESPTYREKKKIETESLHEFFSYMPPCKYVKDSRVKGKESLGNIPD